MSDAPIDPTIPPDLIPWINERRAEIDRVAAEQGEEQAIILREQYTTELTMMLEALEQPSASMAIEIRADPVALLAARPAGYVPTLTLTIDDSKVSVIRASG